MYQNSGFSKEILKCEEIIASKLTIAFRKRRLSCTQILEVMNEFTINKNLIRDDDRLDYYLNKFQHQAIHFHDILKFD